MKNQKYLKLNAERIALKLLKQKKKKFLKNLKHLIIDNL